MQRSEIELLSYTTHKIDVKWVKDLNLRVDSIKLLRERPLSVLFVNFIFHKLH